EGLALKVVFLLVIGWMPSRALVAGLWTFFIFARPRMVKTPGPFLPSCCLIRSVRASRTPPTCFLLSWVSVAKCWTTADLGIALPLTPVFRGIDLLLTPVLPLPSPLAFSLSNLSEVWGYSAGRSFLRAVRRGGFSISFDIRV